MLKLKRMTTFACGALLAAAAVGCAETPEAPDADVPAPAGTKSIRLAGTADVDEALLSRCREWAERNTALTLSTSGPVEVEKAGFDEMTAAASAAVEPDDVGLIVLFRHADEGASHGVFNPEARLVLVNVRAYEHDDGETFARRVERQVMRGIALLLGQKDSPNPFSVNQTYGSLEELDQMGRNFDPPTLRDLQQAAIAAGMSVDQDSDFYMLK